MVAFAARVSLRGSWSETLADHHNRTQHAAYRDELISSAKKNGNGSVRFARGTCGNKRVVAKESAKMELFAPDDEFYPEDLYRQKYGDFKKNGHQRMSIGGQKGVVVPAAKQPYKLRRVWQSGVELSETLAETGNDDHVFEGQEFATFDDARADLMNAHAARVAGLSVEQMRPPAATPEPAVKEERASPGPSALSPLAQQEEPKVKPRVLRFRASETSGSSAALKRGKGKFKARAKGKAKATMPTPEAIGAIGGAGTGAAPSKGASAGEHSWRLATPRANTAFPGACNSAHKGPKHTDLSAHTAALFEEFLTAGAESLF